MSNKMQEIKNRMKNKESKAHTELIDTSVNTEKNNYSKKKATFELDADLHAELKVRAAQERKKMVDIVEVALKNYLKP